MNQADYFRNPWWEIEDKYLPDYKQLNKDYREVYDEMIRQEQEAGKTCEVIGSEYGVYSGTVSRCATRAKKRLCHASPP